MPECGIGLVPDVGGSYILAHAPGRLGEYLGTTASRLAAGDAIYAGFSDYYIPESKWPDLISALEESGDWTLIDAAAQDAPASELLKLENEINAFFGGETLADILNALRGSDSEFAAKSLKTLSRNSPLAMGCTLEIIHRVRGSDSIRPALDQEYRFTYRSMEHGDFLEGIRAQIIDKDRNPRWKHEIDSVPAVDVSKMLMPLGEAKLTFEKGD